ncbi:MAG: dTDP-4-dehydrorhamnose 3,5-epimerase [Candidatus Eremiobacteraeota bacterium]|nr:dTDP-4-dehydrorhamnose 3,5-epimerase [Candidatus Eremiobacteraeota bacterium]
MKLVPTELPDVLEIVEEPHEDERGAFVRLWDADVLAAAGIAHRCTQLSLSRNRRAGTLRGLHYAAPPHAETKLVRCVRGAIHDVAVDVRPGSPSYGRHVARRLDARTGNGLLIPAGFAHGFQTLEDDSDVLYAIDLPYVPAAARAVRYDDPVLAIAWPLPISIVSERDASAPQFARAKHETI